MTRSVRVGTTATGAGGGRGMRPLLQAQLLMLASGLLASFVSLDANYLTHEHAYYHWSAAACKPA